VFSPLKKVAATATPEQIEELRSIVAPESAPHADPGRHPARQYSIPPQAVELAGNERVTSQLQLTLGYVSRLDTLCTQTVPGWIGHADILKVIETQPGSRSAQRYGSAHRLLSRQNDKSVWSIILKVFGGLRTDNQTRF